MSYSEGSESEPYFGRRNRGSVKLIDNAKFLTGLLSVKNNTTLSS